MSKPVTRADRVRSMSDGELARQILRLQLDDVVHFCQNQKRCSDALENMAEIPDEWCVGCVLAWLQSPAEEEEELP